MSIAVLNGFGVVVRPRLGAVVVDAVLSAEVVVNNNNKLNWQWPKHLLFLNNEVIKKIEMKH